MSIFQRNYLQEKNDYVLSAKEFKREETNIYYPFCYYFIKLYVYDDETITKHA